MSDHGIVILGIAIPSSSKVFLTIVVVHVAAGLVCVGAGATAMLSLKAPGRHPAAGTLYYWSLVVVFLSMTVLSNGPSLPLWRSLPALAYWLGPSIVGLPILMRALLRYPLMAR